MSGRDRDFLAALQAWVEIDPDPRTRRLLQEFTETGFSEFSEGELRSLFGGRLGFGTAGIRGAIGPGPMRMNRVVVRHVAAGVARELLSSVVEARTRGVVIGHDARHGSVVFANDVVEVLRAHGLRTHVFGEACPTPLVAFAVQHLGAAAGVVITASHNPATDNGMKVYWYDGAQIIPPLDERISVRFSRALDESLTSGVDTSTVPERDDLVPRNGDTVASGRGALNRGDILSSPDPGEMVTIGGPSSDDPLVLAYLDHARSLISGDREPATSIRIALTSLHGDGSTLARRSLISAGFDDVTSVAEQAIPDPDFPTVAFPNPEEPGVLERLLALAAGIGADVALANDPDADRLAAAFPTPEGEWLALSGDQLGSLLAHHLLGRSGERGNDRLIATTVVSSRLAGKIATAAGAEFHETLTGFKWLSRPGLAEPDRRQVLLYEEALGYAVGPAARDKDGITAALVVADMTRHLKRSARTVWDVLDDLAIRFGAHVQANFSIRISGDDWLARSHASMARLAGSPPSHLAGHAVVRTDRPAADVHRFFLDDDTRVVVRPSGTEPKIKVYCEAIEAVHGEDCATARRLATDRLAAIGQAMRTLLSA